MLIPSLVRFAFDMQIDPTGLRIAVRWPESLDRIAIRAGSSRGDLLDAHGIEPGFAGERPAIARGKRDLILRARGSEAEFQTGPVARARKRFRMHVEGHRGHRDRRPGRDRTAVRIAHPQRFGADPGAELVLFAGPQRYRRGSDVNVAAGSGIETQCRTPLVHYGGVGLSGSAKGGPLPPVRFGGGVI